MTDDQPKHIYETSAARRRSVPAWTISLVVHAIVLILLTLLVRATPRGLSQERDRSVELVLAAADSAQPTKYLDQGEAMAEWAAAAEDPPDENPADALPTSATPPPVPAELDLPELDLPGAELVTGADANGLVQRPSLKVSNQKTRFSAADAEAILAAEAERRRQQAAAGPPTQVSLFGSAPAVGRSFVFLIDRSDSMGGDGLGALGAAEVELKKAIAKLQPHHKFQIIAYHHENTYYSKQHKLLAATPQNTARLKQFLGGLGALGSTKHWMALQSAIGMQPDVIFLLTDGGEPLLNERQIAHLKRQTGGRITIHCIRFGPTSQHDDGHFMELLSAATGGNYGYVNMGGR